MVIDTSALVAILRNEPERPTFRAAIVAVDEDQAHLARIALRRYGKGRHPAQLNFGDCFAYALARGLGQPLLFKGMDFRRTDIECHPASGRPDSVNESSMHYGTP